MGLFLNLLLALLLSWTIIAAIWITGSYPSTKIIATVCLLLAVIISTYGVGTWGPPLRTGSSPEIVLIKMKAL